LVLSGCGPSPANSNAVVENANPTVNTNANLVTIPIPANVNASNVNGIATIDNRSVSNSTGPVGKMKPLTYPAPDNSEFYTTMDSSGQAIETREFHNHPQLIKVTRVWKGVNDKTIHIYLKNGKVVDLPGDKIENINSQPASVFLDAAGIKPAAPPPAAARPPEKKSDDQQTIKKPD
jgi:hypothetical protein